MQRQTERPWTTVVGIVVLLLASVYAAEHPRGIVYWVVKILMTPVP